MAQKRSFFSAAEEKKILESIRSAESNSSGEIRVFAESRCKTADPLIRASAVFKELGMQQTQGRNAVLIYVASKDHKYAVYGDEGIYTQFGSSFWNGKVQGFREHFRTLPLAAAICQVILETGQTLKEKFPYQGNDDTNELPDEIAFGS